MNKKQMKMVEKEFRQKLAKEDETSNAKTEEWEIKAYIRSERKKMKKLKRAGVLS